MMIHYFAYGSNMDEEDFEKRCREKGWCMVKFQNHRAAKLEGYKLSFNYRSTYWEAGAANIMEDEESCVYGLLSEIEDSDLETIRKKEGYYEDCSKCYYNEICINVELLCDGTVVKEVKTYKVTKDKETAEDQRPKEKYMQLIIKNAKIYNFPKEYTEYLESIPTKK